MNIKNKLFYLMPVLNTAFTEGKWNFPIIRKVKEFYQKHGLLLTIAWIVFIVVGTKIVFINGVIFLLNTFLGTDIAYGPVYQFLSGN